MAYLNTQNKFHNYSLDYSRYCHVVSVDREQENFQWFVNDYIYMLDEAIYDIVCLEGFVRYSFSSIQIFCDMIFNDSLQFIHVFLCVWQIQRSRLSRDERIVYLVLSDSFNLVLVSVIILVCCFSKIFNQLSFCIFELFIRVIDFYFFCRSSDEGVVVYNVCHELVANVYCLREPILE